MRKLRRTQNIAGHTGGERHEIAPRKRSRSSRVGSARSSVGNRLFYSQHLGGEGTTYMDSVEALGTFYGADSDSY